MSRMSVAHIPMMYIVSIVNKIHGGKKEKLTLPATLYVCAKKYGTLMKFTPHMSLFYSKTCKSLPSSNNVASSPCAAVSWMPTGRFFPSRFTVPIGTEMAGQPVRLAVTVKMSIRYIARGSDFSPSLGAGDGEVGVTTASTFSSTFLY